MTPRKEKPFYYLDRENKNPDYVSSTASKLTLNSTPNKNMTMITTPKNDLVSNFDYQNSTHAYQNSALLENPYFQLLEKVLNAVENDAFSTKLPDLRTGIIEILTVIEYKTVNNPESEHNDILKKREVKALTKMNNKK
jgi:hypothetical protein